MNREVGIKCGVVKSILQQLRKIHACFQQQRTYRFFDTSILLTYDAENVTPCLKSGELAGLPTTVPVNVRVIDFGKAIPVTDVDFARTNGDAADKEDRNFMLGVGRLIAVLEDLPALYAALPPEHKEKRY